MSKHEASIEKFRAKNARRKEAKQNWGKSRGVAEGRAMRRALGGAFGRIDNRDYLAALQVGI